MTPTIEFVVRYFVLPGLTLGIALAAWRALRGPSMIDRVVGLDLATTLLISLAATWAVQSDQVALLDLGLVIALIAFLGTVGIAYYLEHCDAEGTP